MRVFITGGTGFLGKHLSAAMQEHELLVLCRTSAGTHLPLSCKLLPGDLFDLPSWEKQLRAFRPEVCLHLAWSGLPDYSLATSEKNFQAGLTLFQCLLDIHCPRIVVTGTGLEYGNLTGCVTEDRVPQKLGVFAAFKTAQRLVGQALFASSGIEFIWARPLCIVGPGQRRPYLLPSVVNDLLAGRRPDIRTPDVVQDFSHVEDVARGLAALATSKAPAGVYNLGSGDPTRVRDLVSLIARLLNRQDLYPTSPVAHGPGLPAAQGQAGYWANLDRVKEQTGWQPLLSVEEAVRKTLDCWRENA